MLQGPLQQALERERLTIEPTVERETRRRALPETEPQPQPRAGTTAVARAAQPTTRQTQNSGPARAVTPAPAGRGALATNRVWPNRTPSRALGAGAERLTRGAQKRSYQGGGGATTTTGPRSPIRGRPCWITPIPDAFPES